MGVCVVENLSKVFLSGWTPLHLWVMRVYITWVKGKQVTLKKTPSRKFRDYLAGRPYPRDTRENDSLARLFNLQICAPHMPFSRKLFLRTSLELIAKCTDLQLSLSLHQLNTKPNTIKSHKIQWKKLKQLRHFLSWNKATIKHSCKSKLYRNCFCSITLLWISLIPLWIFKWDFFYWKKKKKTIGALI